MCIRDQLGSVLGAPPEQHIEHRDGAVLPALRVKREIHAAQFHAAHRTSEFRRHPSGHRRQRLALHLFGRGHIQILHSLRARTAGGGSVRAAGGTSGSDTVNVVPSPTVLLTSISPPWASIIPYDTASPSPTPLPSGLVVKNGSKILARFSGRMPSPLSETWSNTTPSPLAVDTVTRRSVRLCVASAAFSTRLSTTCWICEGSHGAAGRSSHNVVSTATLLSFILCSTRESVMRSIRLRSAGARCGLPRRENARRSLTMRPTRAVSLVTWPRYLRNSGMRFCGMPSSFSMRWSSMERSVSYTHLRAHETVLDLV